MMIRLPQNSLGLRLYPLSPGLSRNHVWMKMSVFVGLIGGSRFNFKKCVVFIYFMIWKGARHIPSTFENPIQMISCLDSATSSSYTNTNSELFQGWKLLPCSADPLITEQRTSEHCFPAINWNYRAKLSDPSETCICGCETITNPLVNIFWIIRFLSPCTWPGKWYSSIFLLAVFKNCYSALRFLVLINPP